MRAFYGSPISSNRTKTPEGYLVCLNVPIARIGDYPYLGQEVGVNDKFDKKVTVYRSPEEVFSPVAIASFEGKPVTDNHPTVDVVPDNYNSYLKGIVSNVRKGTNEQEETLIADLIIYDPTLISQIEAGKREVSCGYDCAYEEMADGRYAQKQIRGNHIAVVQNGRAGPTIAIKDSKPIRREKDKMNVLAKMFKSFAKDAEPEEIKEAMDAMMAPNPQAPVPAPRQDAAPAPAAPAAPAAPSNDIGAKLDQLIAIVGQLVQSGKQVHSQIPGSQDSLDALEMELEDSEEGTKDADIGEESHTVPVETMDDAPISNPEDRPKNPIPSADSTSLLKTVRDMKPVIAAIKDPDSRKKATDALIKSIKGQMANDSVNGYAAINKMVQTNTKSKDARSTDFSRLGKDIAKKYNPHYKEVK